MDIASLFFMVPVPFTDGAVDLVTFGIRSSGISIILGSFAAFTALDASLALSGAD
jgi:hypothetical protein